MGKAQSKRSVDITTETKKGTEGGEEITGKLEKIEDVDQKLLNGDANPQENDVEKKEGGDETENDKDLTTEKSAEVAPNSDECGDQINTTATVAESSPKEEGNTEEISPLADESVKKSKKEKMKKKWSFRSISFGKKDKQKPPKTEESSENVAAATNGESADKPAEGAGDASKKDDGAAGDAGNSADKPAENGDATEKELNGQKTPTPTDDDKPIVEAAVNDTTNATTVTSSVNAPAAAAASNNDTAIENQTENKATNLSETVEATANAVAVAITAVSNGSDIEKNGIIESPVTNAATDKAEIQVSSAVIENNKIIPSDEEKPHQNGTNADDEIEAIAEQSKSQIEVNTIIDKNNSEEKIASSLSTSSSDLNVQSQSSKTNDEANSILVAVSEIEIEIENKTKYESEIPEEEKNNTIGGLDAIVTEVATSTNGKTLEECIVSAQQQCESQPPPLPVSPPPSQVSVFAFKEIPEEDEEMQSATLPTELHKDEIMVEESSVLKFTDSNKDDEIQRSESPKSEMVKVAVEMEEMKISADDDIIPEICTPVATEILGEVVQAEKEIKEVMESDVAQAVELKTEVLPVTEIIEPTNNTEMLTTTEEVFENKQTDIIPQMIKSVIEGKPLEEIVEETISPAVQLESDTVTRVIEVQGTGIEDIVKDLPKISIESNESEEDQVNAVIAQFDQIAISEMPETESLSTKSDANYDEQPMPIPYVMPSGPIATGTNIVVIENAATAVVDEITEKAVIIVQQHYDEEMEEPAPEDDILKAPKMGEVEIKDGISQASSVETYLETPLPPESESSSVDTINTINSQAVKTQHTDDIIVESYSSSAQHDLPECIEVSNHTSTSLLIIKNTQEDAELAQNNIVSDTDSDSVSKSPIKEINAKDLKEIAAAEITTQDLPVTCE